LKDFGPLHRPGGHYFHLLESLAQIKQSTYEEVVKRVKKLDAFKLLQTEPGISPVIATGYVALIDTLHS